MDAPRDTEVVHDTINRSKREKTPQERGIEEVIGRAFRACFSTYVFGGRELEIGIPFGQNGERRGSAGFQQQIFRGGKGLPEDIWREADRVLESEDFSAYRRGLMQPGEKVIVFDIERRSFLIDRSAKLIRQMNSGPYPGSRTHIYVLKTEASLTQADVYNYLYCVGALGMDCSGFVYYILRSIAAAYAFDLDRSIAPLVGTTPEQVSLQVGIQFLDPRKAHMELVGDTIDNLRPGDIILFRGRGAGFRHSGVVQAVDFSQGIIRYLQCTDWAPESERGVHGSVIRFDRSCRGVSLMHDSAVWTQEIQPAFTGETGLAYWNDDGDRYRSFAQVGGSVVVRLNIIRDLFERVEPGFYLNVFNEELARLRQYPLPMPETPGRHIHG